MVEKYTTGARVRYGIATADRRHLQYIRQRLVAEHGMVCALCGKPIEHEHELTIDHIIPRSLGGATVYKNCQLAHKKCNLAKGTTYIDNETVEKSNENAKKGLEIP